VAFAADPSTGVWIADSYNMGTGSPWEAVGGTSLSAPCWAGMVAIVNQGRVAAGQEPLNSDGSDEVHSLLYSMSQTDFHSITDGNNGYDAGAGYNLVTGLGSPIANNLIPDLVSGNVSQTGQVAAISAADLVYTGPNSAVLDSTAQAIRSVSIKPPETLTPHHSTGNLVSLVASNVSGHGNDFQWEFGDGASINPAFIIDLKNPLENQAISNQAAKKNVVFDSDNLPDFFQVPKPAPGANPDSSINGTLSLNGRRTPGSNS
jgi:subtilase family serine protease